MSMTYAQQAIMKITQSKQNCNLLQERKYNDYGDYVDVHSDYYDCVYEPAGMVIEKPVQNIVQSACNELFQITK